MQIGVFFDHIRVAGEQNGLTVEDVIRECAQLGIRYVDIDGHYWIENMEMVETLLAQYGMNVGCVDGRFDLAHGREEADAEQLIRLAAEKKVEHVLLIPGFVTEDEDREKAMEQIAQSLNRLIPLAKKLGVRCSLEDYDNETALFGRWEELKWYLDRVDGLEISFDTGNFAFFAQDAQCALDVLKDRVCIVHAKDRSLNRCGEEKALVAVDGTKLYPCAVGSGCIPIRSMLDTLRETGFDGGITIEHFGSLKMLDDIRRSAAWVREYLA